MWVSPSRTAFGKVGSIMKRLRSAMRNFVRVPGLGCDSLKGPTGAKCLLIEVNRPLLLQCGNACN